MIAEAHPGTVHGIPHAKFATANLRLRSDEAVTNAIHYFQKATGSHLPANLYKAYEEILVDLGEQALARPSGNALERLQALNTGKQEIVSKGWATIIEIDDFRAVHRPEDFGDSTRHAESTRDRPQNPMDAQTARQFIEHILEIWIAQK